MIEIGLERPNLINVVACSSHTVFVPSYLCLFVLNLFYRHYV